jgi:hypothetical protein
MARVLAPIGRAPRCRACVVCGETEGGELKTTLVWPTSVWFLVFVLVGCLGLVGLLLVALMRARRVDLGPGLRPLQVSLPFTEGCYRPWHTVRIASRVVLVVAFLAPMVGAMSGSFELLLRASGTALVLLVFPAFLRFGPAVLGPVFRRARDDGMVVDLPSAEAALALEREGWE